MKKTLIIGASLKEERYSNKAIKKLQEKKVPTVSIGLREGKIGDVVVSTEKYIYENIHTVSLYLNSKRQKEYYEYIIGLNPKRVVFNPGTENTEFYKLLIKANIPYEEACTLVLLSTNQF